MVGGGGEGPGASLNPSLVPVPWFLVPFFVLNDRSGKQKQTFGRNEMLPFGQDMDTAWGLPSQNQFARSAYKLFGHFAKLLL